MTVNHNSNPNFGVNSTFELYFYGITNGAVENYKPIKINIIYPWENSAPVFKSDLELGYTLTVYEDDQIDKFPGGSEIHIIEMPDLVDVDDDDAMGRWKLRSPDLYSCNCIDLMTDFTVPDKPRMWI